MSFNLFIINISNHKAVLISEGKQSTIEGDIFSIGGNVGLGKTSYTNHEIKIIESDEVALGINSNSAVCFSQDSSYYKTMGNLFGEISMIICAKSIAVSGKCPVQTDLKQGDQAYLIEWNRFSNITKYRWSGSDWSIQ